MAANEIFIDIMNERIDDYEETWKKEYEVAELCWEFEQQLGGYVELYRCIFNHKKRWSQSVFSGEIPYTTELERSIKALFERWLSLAGQVDLCLDYFEDQQFDGGVKGAEAYRGFVSSAKHVLATWRQPALSAAIGLRRVVLTEEQSVKFRELLS
jgi:hypothetical protein